MNPQYSNQPYQSYPPQGYGEPQHYSNEQYGTQQHPQNYYGSPQPGYGSGGYVYPDASGSAGEYTKFHSSNSQPSSGEKFSSKRQFKDLWAAILFLLFLVGFSICAGVGVSYFRTEIQKESSNVNSGTLERISPGDFASIILGTVGFGAALSLVYFLLLQKFAGTMIKASIFIYLAFGAAAVAFLFFARNIVGGIIGLLFLCLMAWFYYACRHRIPFAKVLLKSVTKVISKYPSTIFGGVVALVLQVAFSLFWIVAVIGMALKFSRDAEASGKSVNGGLIAIIVFLMFSLYWISEVIKNVLHVTVSGLFATYYFFGISTGGQVVVNVSNPTAASFKRAITTSFGSICYGSLLIAIIQTMKQLMDQAARDAASDGNFLACFCAVCASCILQCIGDILEYFNHYAFTQVAIYGKDYCEAAKSTWRLVKTKGIDALINDNFVGTVLGLGVLLIGLMTAGFACLLVQVLPSIERTATAFALFGIGGFIIGMIEFGVLAEVITSGVSTTFVCLAEDPQALARTKPELFEKIRQTYPSVMLQ